MVDLPFCCCFEKTQLVMLLNISQKIYSGFTVVGKYKVRLIDMAKNAEGRFTARALHFFAIGGSMHGQDAVTPAAQECACPRLHAECFCPDHRRSPPPVPAIGLPVVAVAQRLQPPERQWIFQSDT
ncbi:hypothetical protein V4842_25590 [Pseudomonas moraviensis]